MVLSMDRKSQSRLLSYSLFVPMLSLSLSLPLPPPPVSPPLLFHTHIHTHTRHERYRECQPWTQTSQARAHAAAAPTLRARCPKPSPPATSRSDRATTYVHVQQPTYRFRAATQQQRQHPGVTTYILHIWCVHAHCMLARKHTIASHGHSCLG